jgi:hypothetical protein
VTRKGGGVDFAAAAARAAAAALAAAAVAGSEAARELPFGWVAGAAGAGRTADATGEVGAECAETAVGLAAEPEIEPRGADDEAWREVEAEPAKARCADVPPQAAVVRIAAQIVVRIARERTSSREAECAELPEENVMPLPVR